MRKFLYLLSLVLIASASNSMAQNRAAHNIQDIDSQWTAGRLSNGTATRQFLTDTPVTGSPRKAPVARTAPEGTLQWYSTSWMCLFYEYVIDNTGVASQLCYGDNGEVNFYDITSSGQDVWTKATIDDEGTIRIPLHGEAGADQRWGKLTLEVANFEIKEGQINAVIIPDAEYYVLKRRSDGVIVSDDIDKDWMERTYMVLIDEYGRVYSLCGAITMTPVEDEVVTPPAGAEVKDYTYLFIQYGNMYSMLTQAAYDGNDVYVQGLCDALPDIWLKGEYNEDKTKIVFRSGQYMGPGQYHHYFSAAHQETETIDGEEELVWKLDDNYVCTVSDDGKTIYLDNEHKFTVTIAGDVAYAIDGGKLIEYHETLTTPAAPIISGVEDIEGICVLFYLPTWDVDGNFINPDNLSWRLYFDDQLYTFDPAIYGNLSESMTEIEYGFIDNWDFFFDGEQRVYIYEDTYKNIGIESVYTLNGESRVSERTYYGTVTGMDSARLDGKKPLRVTYTDLGGRTVEKPCNGLYIRTETYGDGTVKHIKVLEK